ncbi:16S rRNA (guanine(527)-N(7))-methyltransferase RsmG [Rivularia sp. UHCC 0363]|uniref:16S rRNA (guanine(527)-N(7))-methyltransferase RsmG n=1 Tax=Rivularia sp. UHCC 0363 TaxID=3110244 RepID=UPI002B21051B|nr:16S rRNA (guanine(527)-N(7))-methyltransferase RsmG [Rivularia sp. UHCC 0363]MEA5595978.1 16S rRNA (guanine(527)-N(7))-methyltransferase RsmG [Rivularia sp. UHCC 0363]
MNDSTISCLPQMTDIWEKTLDWKPSPQQQELFQRLYGLILEGNRQLNLTRITDPEDFWEKHLWDSLRGIKFLISVNEDERREEGKEITIIDLGTGAGFPGIPVAIAVKNCTVNLVDSTKKKITFINSILPQLNLNNLKATTCRAEEIGRQRQHREAYDIALIRAVASASACAEYALPLLKQGGLAVVYRGSLTDEETINMENAVEQLGGIIESIEKFNTPISNSDRHCLYLRKVANTPAKFPRAVGVPAQRPL